MNWEVRDELSLDKEKSKQSMIYYAFPEGKTYGYFSALNREARDRFLAEMGCDAKGRKRP